MDLKVLLLVLCFTFTTVQGVIPRCCVSTTRIPLRILQEVEKFDVQSRRGACEIDALVLHYKEKKYCAKPRAKKILEAIKHQKMWSQYMV